MVFLPSDGRVGNALLNNICFSTFLTLRSGVQRVCHETSDNMRNGLVRFFLTNICLNLFIAPICRGAVCSRIVSR